MEDHREVGVADFLNLMKGYVDLKIDALSYQKGFFALMKRRSNLTEDEFRVLQTAFVDADDYDPILRLEYTITEPELRRRVANSISDLDALGYDAVQVDINPHCS
jgi:hypothetical protein